MERIDRMMPDLYKAAVEGRPDDYYEALRRMAADGVGRQVTPNGNTVLHVAALHGQKHLVEKLLARADAFPMLLAKNHKSRTVLHCAAQKGHVGVVCVIIDAIKEAIESGVGVTELIRMTDIVGDTALHKAVRMGHVEVVKLLVQEDREFEYLANDAGETPIYIAAESIGEDLLFYTYRKCLVEMLSRFEKPSYGGPLGRNTLHAAVLSGGIFEDSPPVSRWKKLMSCFKSSSEHHVQTTDNRFIKLLLEKEISLCEMKDDFGWTPLHYAARINDGEATRMIVEAKSSAAYIRAGRGDDWTTVFHIAAREGHVEIMKYISDYCPDCWDMVNSKGQNVLHETILRGRMNVLKYIESCNQLDNNASEEDDDGNTPIHLLNISDVWPKEVMINLLPKNHLVFNKQHQTPVDIFMEHQDVMYIDNINEEKDKLFPASGIVFCRYGHRSDLTENSRKKYSIAKKDEAINIMVRSSETNIIVAILISTVTFAAGFTVPGGYDSNVGSEQAGKPILIRNAAFKAFVITDVVAFICSMLAVIIYGWLVSIAASAYGWKYRTVPKLFHLGNHVLLYAFLGVVVAFLCGMYATLEPSLGLAIAVLALGFGIPLLAHGKLYHGPGYPGSEK